MKSIVKERELDFIDILNEGWKIYFFKFKDIAIITLGIFLPINLIIQLIGPRILIESGVPNIAGIILFFLLILLSIVISTIVTMAIAIITEKVIDHKEISALGAIREALPKWGSALLTSLLKALILFGLYLLFIIPGIIFSVSYIFVIPVVALRGKFGKEALDYSKKLVEGQWWRIFGILFGLGIIFGVLDIPFTLALIRISNNIFM